MKKCSKCGVEYPATNEFFHVHKGRKFGLASNCKKCKSEYKKNYTKINNEIVLERQKLYRDANREILNEKHRQYYKDNKNESSISAKKYYGRNKYSLLEHQRQYSKNNREKVNMKALKYKSRKNKLPSTLTIDQWESIRKYFGNRCAYCGKEEPLAQEHFVPLSKGGEYTHNNIICACLSCNSSKGAKEFRVWYLTFKFYSKTREQKIIKYLNYKNEIQQLTFAL